MRHEWKDSHPEHPVGPETLPMQGLNEQSRPNEAFTLDREPGLQSPESRRSALHIRLGRRS
jgi:hypothetical protein